MFGWMNSDFKAKCRYVAVIFCLAAIGIVTLMFAERRQEEVQHMVYLKSDYLQSERARMGRWPTNLEGVSRALSSLEPSIRRQRLETVNSQASPFLAAENSTQSEFHGVLRFGWLGGASYNLDFEQNPP